MATTPTQWRLYDNETRITYLLDSYMRPGNTTYTRAQATSITFPTGYAWTLNYGSEEELSSLTDSFGRTLTFTWLTGEADTPLDHKVLIDTIGLPDGTALKYAYGGVVDQATDITQHSVMTKVSHLMDVNGSGSSNILSETIYHHDDPIYSHLLTGITDGRGERYQTWTYDAAGRAISSSRGNGQETTSFAYAFPTSTTQTVTVTNPLGKATVYNFTYSEGWVLNSIDGLASVNCPASEIDYTYSGKLVQTATDEEGNVLRVARYASGLPSAITQAYGTSDARVTMFEWRTDRQIETIGEPGLATEYGYDGQGRLSSVTQTDTTTHTLPYATAGQTRAWTYTYTVEGLLATVDGPLSGTGDTRVFTYDADGYLATSTDELGHVTTITAVDDVGRPLSATDPNGIVTEFEYDPRGYLATATLDPSGAAQVTAFTYDEIGQLTAIETADGVRFDYEYDAARWLKSITDAKGNTYELSHDDMGNVVGEEIKDSALTVLYAHSATFDELGRLLTSVGADTQTWTYGYDKVSNLVSSTDPRNGTSTQAFNGLNEVIETVDQELNATSLTRDGRGDVATHEDPRGIDATYVRNGWGEIISETSPDIGTTVYERNMLGLVSKKTDARGVETTYTHDDVGRLTGTSYPASGGEDVVFTYDDISAGNLGAGRLTGFTDEVGSTDIIYNSLGLVASETVSLLGAVATTAYDYDDAGNVERLTYPSGRVVEYARDADGDITAVTTRAFAGAAAETIAKGIAWHPFEGWSSLEFGNGLLSERSLDLDYRIDRLTVSDGTSDLIDRVYRFEDDLNLTEIEDIVVPWQTQNFDYSARNMLSGTGGPWGDETYSFDGVGNATSYVNDQGGGAVTNDLFTYPPTSNRLDSIARNGTPVRDLTYDDAGNILTDTLNGVTTEYEYNHANRLISVERGGVLTGEYVYNARGQLVIRSVTNTAIDGVTVYFYDTEGRVLAEFDGVTQNLKREYVWLGDTPIAIIDAGLPASTSYIHSDHLNRPVKMTDGGQNVVAEVTWLPFGGWLSFGGFVDLDLRFPGQMYQAESGLHYNWHRHYDPYLARYTQPDPLGLVDGPSRYAYAGNDPLQQIDPDGLQGFSPGASAVIDLAQECARIGISPANAHTLLTWANEYGIRNSGGIEMHPGSPYWNVPHINIKNIHIRIR